MKEAVLSGAAFFIPPSSSKIQITRNIAENCEQAPIFGSMTKNIF